MKKVNVYFAAITALSLSLFSCNKDETGSALTDSELLKASTVVDYVNETDFQTSMETAGDNSSLRASDGATTALTTCATIDIATGPGNSFPKTFTLDFGTGCTNNGITRSGILVFTLSGNLLENGTTLTISRNNYHVNGYKVEGDVVYVNQTMNADVPQWSRTVANGQITTPAGLVYTHSGTRTVKQTGGVSTLLILGDNVFEVTSGNATITGPTGASLTATITTPLIKNAACIYISQGVLNLQGTYLDGDLDYGDNNCDNIAIYTHSDGTTYTVHL
ncbi:MAG TPA: hypothetical protein VK623_11015 [Flavobacterium sp.]|nr:hypothetical protein [Flavobacterium sp.]